MERQSDRTDPGGGYEFARALLERYNADANKIFQHCKRKRYESDWLELKSFKHINDPARWSVVRAVVSLANWCGGLLILGVWENEGRLKLTVPIGSGGSPPSENDEDREWERFLKNIRGGLGSFSCKYAINDSPRDSVTVADPNGYFFAARPTLIEPRTLSIVDSDGNEGHVLGVIIMKAPDFVSNTARGNGMTWPELQCRKKTSERGRTETIHLGLRGEFPESLRRVSPAEIDRDRNQRGKLLRIQAEEVYRPGPIGWVRARLFDAQEALDPRTALPVLSAIVVLGVVLFAVYKFKISISFAHGGLVGFFGSIWVFLLVMALVGMARFTRAGTGIHPGGIWYLALIFILMIRQAVSSASVGIDLVHDPTIRSQFFLSVVAILPVVRITAPWCLGTVRLRESPGFWLCSATSVFLSLLVMLADTDLYEKEPQWSSWREDNSHMHLAFLVFAILFVLGARLNVLGLVVGIMILRILAGLLGWMEFL